MANRRMFKAIIDAWNESAYTHPEWRTGQALFNVLREANPRLAERLRVSDANPFYDDNKTPEAIIFIQDAYWEE